MYILSLTSRLWSVLVICMHIKGSVTCLFITVSEIFENYMIKIHSTIMLSVRLLHKSFFFNLCFVYNYILKLFKMFNMSKTNIYFMCL